MSDLTPYQEAANMREIWRVFPSAPLIYDFRRDGFIPNGCSCAPDGWPGVGSFRAACDDHDFLYWLGGDEADRLAADRALRRLMVANVRSVPRWRWLKRRRIWAWAQLYYRAVRCCGGDHFAFDPPEIYVG